MAAWMCLAVSLRKWLSSAGCGTLRAWSLRKKFATPGHDRIRNIVLPHVVPARVSCLAGGRSQAAAGSRSAAGRSKVSAKADNGCPDSFGVRNETLSVVAMSVSNPGRLPFGERPLDLPIRHCLAAAKPYDHLIRAVSTARFAHLIYKGSRAPLACAIRIAARRIGYCRDARAVTHNVDIG